MCKSPILAYRTSKKTSIIFKDGKKYGGHYRIIFNLKDLRPNEYILEYLQLPCGKCDECLLKRSRDWSVRCYHESLSYTDSCFLTITYNEKNLPFNNGVPTLCYSDIQKFMKRLRKDLFKRYNIKVRFFCSREYGGKTFRPHYHIILFGFCPKNLNFFRKSYSSLPIYRSPYFEKIWSKGYVFVGTTTPKSIGYVARYTLDKVKHQKELNFNEFREKEGMACSKRPALGKNWFYDNLQTFTERCFLSIEGKKFGIPKTYMNWLKLEARHLYNHIHSVFKKFFIRKRLYEQCNDYDPKVKKYEEIVKNMKFSSILQRLTRNLGDDFFQLLD